MNIRKQIREGRTDYIEFEGQEGIMCWYFQSNDTFCWSFMPKNGGNELVIDSSSFAYSAIDALFDASLATKKNGGLLTQICLRDAFSEDNNKLTVKSALASNHCLEVNDEGTLVDILLDETVGDQFTLEHQEDCFKISFHTSHKDSDYAQVIFKRDNIAGNMDLYKPFTCCYLSMDSILDREEERLLEEHFSMADAPKQFVKVK